MEAGLFNLGWTNPMHSAARCYKVNGLVRNDTIIYTFPLLFYILRAKTQADIS